MLSDKRIYTVSQLSRLAGVSVRTLHYYDQVGLLKPARREGNGFREYCYEHVVILQQILIYRELDFSIKKIREILTADGYDLLKVLESQQSMLLKRINQTQLMINSIEVTMNNVRGKLNKDIIFEGFPKEKTQRWDKIQQDKDGAELTESNLQMLGKLSEDEARRYGEQSGKFYTQYAKLLKLPIESLKVQEHVMEHYHFMNNFIYTLQDEFKGIGYKGYLHFADWILSDEVSAEIHEHYSAGLSAHLHEAMSYFAEHTLKDNLDELRKNIPDS